jgi:putative flippase GtrA
VRIFGPIGVSEPSVLRAKIIHFGGFLLGGGLSFVTDVGVFQLLNAAAGVPPLMARPFAISLAMVVSWLINRTITFPMPGLPRVREFLHFAALAWVAALLNYAVFALVLWLCPAIWPPTAIFLAALAAMVLAYVNMRYSVFKK